MKKNTCLFVMLCATILFLAIMVSCNFEPYAGEARIGIDLDSLFQSGSAADGTRAIYLPSELRPEITSAVITVSGPGISAESTTYTSLPRYLYVYVPAGRERTVGLELHLDPLSKYAVLTFGGEATISLKPGQYQLVTVKMAPIETKLVISDQLGSRLVQVNDITGSGWLSRTANDGINAPTDIDFDSSGRIFMASNGGGILVIDNLTDMNITPFGSGRLHYTIAIDRINHYAYYMTQTGPLYKTNIDDQQDETTFAVSGEIGGNFNTSGIAVDDEGYVYITDRSSSGVYKYNPDPNVGNRIVASYTNLPFDPRDVLVKDGYVYVATISPNIVRLTTDLTSPQIFGSVATGAGDTSPGHLFGPSRFVGISQQHFCLIDEGSLTYPVGIDLDRVIVFNSPGGWSGWEARQGAEMTGGDEFGFFIGR